LARFTITLITPVGEWRFECPEDECILDRAEESGLEGLPWSCRSGTCATCVGRLVSGEVDQADQFALSDELVARGYVLLCSARPLSDCVIETHKQDELAAGG